MRTVVVGASSGLGRFIGVGLAQRGDQVALLARRTEKLVDAAADAGPGATVIPCDVTSETSCREAVAEAAKALGGIDAVVYTPGIGPLVRLEEMDADTWRRVLDTNVVGASLVTAAALPHLRDAHGTMVYLSSVSASLTAPWPGLAAYAVSKAALDKLVDAWRGEHPGIGFTRVIVGETMGGEGEHLSEFATTWDPDLAGELFPVWMAKGMMSGSLMEASEVLAAVAHVTSCGPSARYPSVTVMPRVPVS